MCDSLKKRTMRKNNLSEKTKKVLSEIKDNKGHLLFAFFLVLAFWLVYGLGQISGSRFSDGDDAKLNGAISLERFVQLAESRQMTGKIVILDEVRVTDQLGNVWLIDDFERKANADTMDKLRNLGFSVNGGLKVQLVRHEPAAGQMAFGNFIDMLGRIAITLLYVLFIAFILQQVKLGGGGMFSKPFRKVSPETSRLPSFADVAGHSGPKKEIEEIVEYLRDSGRFSKAGARPPRGILLYGPPGNGKTMLAKAVAGEAQAAFLEQNASSFIQMFAGMGAMRVRDLFRTAREQKPCVIFIDEIDSIGLSRDAGGAHEERLQTVNALLAELDGFDNNDGIVVIAATNRLAMLDEALVRPGRFDRKVFVPLPSRTDRLAILAVHAAKLPAVRADLERWSRRTHGFSGADLANLVNEAAMEAARGTREIVVDLDFDKARDRILMGPRNLGSSMGETERLAVAFHETGHAVARLVSGKGDVEKVSILPRGASLGVTVVGTPEEDVFLTTKGDIEKELVVLMGGRAAEAVFCGDVSSGAADDLEKASRLARLAVSRFGFDELGPYVPEHPDKSSLVERRAAEWVRNAYERAIELLRKEDAFVRAVVERLIDNDEIDGEEMSEIRKALRTKDSSEQASPENAEPPSAPCS